MVKSTTILTVCVTLFITLILPIIVYVVYGVRNKGKGVWTAWLLGASGFFVFQVIIRLPILSLLSMTKWFPDFARNHYVPYCLILAFTAGLFEVAGRYAAAKLMQKNLTYERGLAAGLGHGGIESILLIGVTYLNNLIYIIMINVGAFDDIIKQTADMGADTSALVTIQDTLLQSGSGIYLLAGYERILSMIFHTALSLLVCYFVSQKKDLTGIIICLICHTIIDFVNPIISGMSNGYLGNGLSVTISYVIIYGFLSAVAIASILGIIRLKRLMSKKD